MADQHAQQEQEERRPRRGPRAWWRGFREWPRFGRVTAYAVAVLVVVLVAVGLTATALVRRPFPQVDGRVAVPGLAGDVTVVRDEHGIPQLYADTLPDLMRAQGYVQAQERFYEMDVRRHATAGRLSELFGDAGLESDKLVRTMGWRRVAEQELALVEPETRAALTEYAEGVNAYLEDRSPSEISVAYTLLNASGLGYQPEPWTPVDSLAWLKAMAWDLRGNMEDEVDRALTRSAVGDARTAELYPAYPYAKHHPIVSGGGVVDGVFDQDATEGGTRNPERPAPWGEGGDRALRGVKLALDAMPAWLGRGDGIGSNSFVVDGDHSTTGAPLLANDPHLGVGLPGVWMQMGLHCRTVSDDCPLDVAGFTFSGVPGVIIGHNQQIAWGFTNLDPDVSDLYVERVSGDTWLHDGTYRPLRTRTETIKVAGGDDVTLTVRSTAHGPILSDASDDYADVAASPSVPHAPVSADTDDDYAVSLQWTALTPGVTADAILELDAATSWEEFRSAASSFEVPAQNLVYADRAGHIGYQAPGRIPIRKSGNDGRLPSAGWRSENDWTGDHVPFAGLPSVLDPDEGFVVTANQAVTDRDYPYFLTDDWDQGYRSERIRDVLGAGLTDDAKVSPQDLLDVQLDDRNPMAAVLTPYLLDVQLPRGYYRAGQHVLQGWDFGQDADSAGAAYFNVVWAQVLARTFRDELPRAVWPTGGSRWMAVVSHLLEDPRNAWWDDLDTDGVVEDRDDILRAAMISARDELTRRVAQDPREWTWGALHHLDLEEPTLGDSGIAVAERVFNRGGWEVGGGTAAVDAAGWDASGSPVDYTVDSAPSMRMVVSLGDLDDSRWINVTGVSGHPFNAHYTDQTDLWADGRTLPWAFTEEAVEDAGEHTLTLTPGQPTD